MAEAMTAARLKKIGEDLAYECRNGFTRGESWAQRQELYNEVLRLNAILDVLEPDNWKGLETCLKPRRKARK